MLSSYSHDYILDLLTVNKIDKIEDRNQIVMIFWQDMISDHQLPYISKLPKINNNIKVIYVAETRVSDYRIKMGWTNNKLYDTSQVSFVIAPSKKRIIDIISGYPNALHFFSGIQAFPMVYQAFKLSLNFNLKRYLIVEGPSYFRRPKPLHIVKTYIQDRRYFSKIDKVFAIGKDAREWYSLWGFHPNQIIPFSYSVQKVEDADSNKNLDNRTLNLLFVGRLVELKGVKKLVKTVLSIEERVRLDIIGEGPQQSQLRKIILADKTDHSIEIYGFQPNLELRQIMNKYDCLILPSLYDGWGAVVNEALMAGLFVICSDRCGAQDLILEDFNGIVFSQKKRNDLKKALAYCNKNLYLLRSRKASIKDWSKSIEPETIAKYFLSSLNSDEIHTPPWKYSKSVFNQTYSES